ncbi:Neutral ceramidase [Phlyctochytrium bullatum]|nr:Neutral ceramidase [Phlyctochytrium bullatum]
MMGYARIGQNARGIQTRLYARGIVLFTLFTLSYAKVTTTARSTKTAFVFAHPADKNTRAVYISADQGTSSRVVKQRAIDLLPTILPKAAADLYTDRNVMVSATHTHSGTGGFNDDFMYQVPSFGIYRDVREKIAIGLAKAIAAAHWDLEAAERPGDITMAEGFVLDANMNRSPKAYELNPKEEKEAYGTNVDKTFPVFTVYRGGLNASSLTPAVLPTLRPRGAFSFFPVHGVSMNNSNELISGDNKGVASYLWEIEERLNQANPTFVAAFGQSNAGDSSPNVDGPRCIDTGLPCDGLAGSCGGKVDNCVARGPGYNIGGMRESTKIIAQRQFAAAFAASRGQGKTAPTLLKSTAAPSLHVRHAWVDMSNIEVTLPNSRKVRTCPPAMGQSFSAGTIDGTVGLAAPNQTANPILTLVRDLIFTRPSDSLLACHAPKPVLLPTGEATFPYPWQPRVMPLQLFVVGPSLAIVGFPSEITTMSGRRLRAAIKAQLVADGVMDPAGVVAIAGLSNTYNSYVTTYEEYQFQAYEGASTVFGPHTLTAYTQQFVALASSIANPALAPPAGSPPPLNADLSTENPVVLDAPPIGQSFGQVVAGPAAGSIVKPGQTLTMRYACAHPRNGVGSARGGVAGAETFAAVERMATSGAWEVVMDDAAFDTGFVWYREGVAASYCEVSWSVGETWKVQPGMYRLRGYGNGKITVPFADDRFVEFNAVSSAFQVVA